MENAEGEHGVTASTERDKVIQDLLNHLETLKPQRKGHMKMSAKPGKNQTPTFLPGGMLFEDRKGRTRAVWDEVPNKRIPWNYKFVGLMLFVFAGCLLAATDITVPALWPVGTTASTGYLCYVIARHGVRRNAQHRPNTPVRVPERRTAPDVHRDWYERIGDAERDQVISTLGIHFSAGRLDADEYDERSTATIMAKTDGDLSKILKNLPALTREERKSL